jgi:predicted kinase
VPPTIIVLVGLPASGKSTWLERRGLRALSSDEMRRTLADDATDQTIHRQVFAALRYLLRARLRIGRKTTYVDATHLTPRERRPYIEIARRSGCRVEALYFATPIAECRRRNRRRKRFVPPAVIERMAARLVPPSRAEGFDRVRTVRPSRAESQRRPRAAQAARRAPR